MQQCELILCPLRWEPSNLQVYLYQLVLGVEQIVVAEAMLLGESLGLDPAVLASVINSSTGGCWSSSVNNPVPSALPDKSPPCERDYEGGFATSLMLKVCVFA